MSQVYKYRIWCSTENAYRYIWRDGEQGAPTTCPEDTAHSVDTNKVTVVDTADIAEELYSEYGGLVVSATYDAVEDDCEFMGLSFVASGDATTIFDMKIEYVIRIHGGEAWVASGHWGDEVSFAVVDKDDVLGLFAIYGVPEGGILELSRLVKDNPIIPDCSGYFHKNYNPPTVSEVVSGLYFRCIYDNNDQEDAYVGASLLTYRV